MKSIEEKARRYDEAIAKFNVILNLNTVKESGTIFADDVRKIFSELAESEDERIRKGIIKILETFPSNTTLAKSVNKEECIAWLEKQNSNVDNANKEYWIGYREGKQEILDKYAELEKQGEQKPVDKVEPKFRVKYAGSEYNVLEVKDIAGVTYYGIEDEPNHIDYVLPDNCEIVSEQKPADSYCQENCKGFQETGKCFADGDCKAKRDTEQKHAWSEEDKNTIQVLKNIVRHSDEIDENIYTMSLKEKLYDWLKSLRPQSQWKPSEEQIKVLEFFIPYVTKCSIVLEKSKGTLLSLLSDLKKLKG